MAIILAQILIEYAVYQLEKPFTYFYCGEKKLEEGFRVLVTFNKRIIIGYVLSTEIFCGTPEEYENKTGFAISEILEIIDDSPLLNNELLMLADEISDYYLSPKIKVLQTMLPSALSPKRSSQNGPKIAYEYYVRCINDNEDGLTHKQIEVLRYVSSTGLVNKKEIKSKVVLENLLKLGRIVFVKREKCRFIAPHYDLEKDKELTIEQECAVNEFISTNDKVYLLEGVTGSGKTEVYLHISKYVLKLGFTVLILVPEISLTPMIMSYFIKRFGQNVAILHSGLSPAEKYDEYRKISNGECSVVVGARSAIFAPLKNIGLIILDEEHVDTYKQDTPPFYHSREVAIFRANHFDECKVILGSATPSLESKIRAERGFYHHLILNKRINNLPLPTVSIVDMGNYKNIDKSSFLFSKQLTLSLSHIFKQNEQAILLLNKRGFSSSITCRNCGHIFTCPNCEVPLTYHKKDNMLKCHHCGYVDLMKQTCPKCGSKYLSKSGFGSERVENEIHKLFPEAKVLRLDSDASKIKNRTYQIIDSFSKREADVMVGTQMVAKGHDFSNVTLVGIIQADVGLSMPDFRSAENTFQLLTQAIGRCGRAEKPGSAIVQTYLPTHYAVTLSAKQDYASFFLTEVKNRNDLHYPPFYSLALITCCSKKEDVLNATALEIVIFLKENLASNATILGPSFPYIEVKNKIHYRNILIKFKDQKSVKMVIRKMINIFNTKNSVGITVNIDPYNF